MRIKIIAVILIFILTGLFFGDETEDPRYTQICTRGVKGYQKFRGEYGVNSRIQFWTYFYNLILNLKVKKAFGKIIACAEFWEELKQDELFDFDEGARADKEEINNIFTNAKSEYRKDFNDRMLALDPIDLKGEKDTEKIKEYTDDKEFTRIIEIYASNYIIISKNPLPKKEDIDDISERWQEISKDNRVKDTIKKPIDDYFNQLESYYRIQIKETDTFDQKLETSRSKKTKLEEIKKIAGNIEKFDINQQLPQINEMIRYVDFRIKYWQRHKTINDMITAFEKKQDPTIDDLYDTKKKVMAAAQEGQEWEKPFYERIKFFWDLPGKRYLTIQWYEKNVEPYLDDNNKVIEVFKTGYKNRLYGKVVKKMNDGGNSIEDISEIEILTDKYKRLFNKGTGKEDCLVLIRRYYEAKERLDYPGMMKLYDENPDIVSACDNLVRRAWNLKNSKEAVQEEYKKHYSRLMHNALDDEGRKDETTFDDFWLIHQKKYWKLPEEYQQKFDYLYTYFKSSQRTARQKAQKDLHQHYPHLASSYNIPDPQADIISTGDGREHTGDEELSNGGGQTGSADTPENDYKNLEKMWQTVKKMKTEQEVVKYICYQAPLSIKGLTSAEKTLAKILKWHNQWSIFEKTSFKEFKALAMLGEMLTRSDNLRDQNKLYNHIIVRMSKANINSFQMPEPEQNRTMTIDLIKTIIDNNKEYLNLLNGNKSGKNLDSIEQSLRHEFLTTPQKIRVYYQFGTLSSKLRSDLPASPCYHFAKAWELMHEKKYKQLNFDWKGHVIIWKSDLAAKICLHCRPFKKNQAAMDEFNRLYPKSDLDIDTLCERALSFSPVEKGKPTGGVPDDSSRSKDAIKTADSQEELPKFMEKMYEYILNGSLDDPTLKGVYDQLLKSKTKDDFDAVLSKYRTHIPGNYNTLMNRFFQVLSLRKAGWKNRAAKILEAGKLDPEIKKIMTEYLDEIKEIY